VLGLPASYWGGSYANHANWAAATLRPTTGSGQANCEFGSSRSSPTAYCYGGTRGPIPSASTTSLNHGNYDYSTNGVAYWEGGSNHTLKNSMYYGAAPAFFGNCAWPAFGPDLTPTADTVPAKVRFEGGTSCGGELKPPGKLKAVAK
jgi:hypothetical protein